MFGWGGVCDRCLDLLALEEILDLLCGEFAELLQTLGREHGHEQSHVLVGATGKTKPSVERVSSSEAGPPSSSPDALPPLRSQNRYLHRA